MKKYIILLLFSIIFITPVKAASNKLYFTESGNRLYYNSSLLDEDVFMKHIDMVPGSSYRDELIVENGTGTTYKVYFQIKPRKQNAVADALLDSIEMKIYLDGRLLYDGKVKGLDYSGNGVNLQNAVEIGTFAPGQSSTMVTETHLSSEYTNPEEDDISYIDWAFFGEWYQNDEIDNEVPKEQEPKTKRIEKAPQTGINANIKLYSIAVISAIAILLAVYLYDRKRINNN